METQRLHYLFEQFDENRISEADKTELLAWLGDYGNREEALHYFESAIASTTPDTNLDTSKWNKIIQEILAAPGTPVRRMWNPIAIGWRRWAVAASIVLALGVGSYLMFFNNKSTVGGPQSTAVNNKDVEAPKGTKAMITLADGRTISIDSLTSISQHGVNIQKTAEGKIIYNGSATDMAFNTLTNPRGSKVIDMTMSDGSRVWLNAGSSVRYPVAFGNERKVSITGEAYFEVTHNASMPFRVSLPSLGGVGGGEVTVLGTHFNVNAYDDEEAIKVTLLEGSVKVSNSGQAVTIRPGEQARITSNQSTGPGGQPATSNNIDLEEVMAWKNGLFSFNKADIKTVMKQLARWYDMEVIYTSEIKETFYVKMDRNTNVSNVFKILETTGGVHFEIEGKTIIVKQ